MSIDDTIFVLKQNTAQSQEGLARQGHWGGIRNAGALLMISDPLGSGAAGNRYRKGGAQPTTSDSLHGAKNKPLPDAPQSSSLTCAITGPALLQTEQVLLRRAPEYVPIIQQIRKGGSIAVQSSDSDQEGTFNLYRVSTSPEGCKMIAEALSRTLEAQQGHPASLRVLVNTWKKLQEQVR